jgi:hypothetical protein
MFFPLCFLFSRTLSVLRLQVHGLGGKYRTSKEQHSSSPKMADLRRTANLASTPVALTLVLFFFFFYMLPLTKKNINWSIYQELCFFDAYWDGNGTGNAADTSKKKKNLTGTGTSKGDVLIYTALVRLSVPVSLTLHHVSWYR